MEPVAAGAGLEVEPFAAGIIEVVETLMERALRRVSVEQGADPRQAALLAFGGAGGLHASALARRLEMPAVLIPPYAGVFSALGLLMSPPRHHTARTVLLAEGDEQLGAEVERLLVECREEFRRQVGSESTMAEVHADLRYPGQSHETLVPHHPGEGWRPQAARFHRLHHQLNGFSRPDQEVELVTIRTAVSSAPSMSWSDLALPPPRGERVLGERQLPGGEVVLRIHRPALAPGDEVTGPAVIEEPHATTWIDGDERASVLEDGTLEIVW
jgi:N-methylhydantoinase A